MAKLRVLILLVSLVACQHSSQAFLEGLLNTKRIKKEYKSQELQKKTPKSLSIFLISNANLYPDANHGTELGDRKKSLLEEILSHNLFFRQYFAKHHHNAIPDSNSKIVYQHSQVLLQEAIREVLAHINKKPLDLVIFGGNQVFSNKEEQVFDDITTELRKYSVSYFQILGPNELIGPKKISSFQEDKFYMLRTKDTSILVLDNVSQEVIPANLPEEANEQYVWLNDSLQKLNRNQEELIIFSYHPLDNRTVKLINSYQDLNLKLVAYSSRLEYEKHKSSPFIHESKPIYISNSALSSYPCSYSIVSRDHSGNYNIENKSVGLKQIIEIARERWLN